MLKKGKYRAFRNLPVGWMTHSIHGRDTTEIVFHIINEILLLMIVYYVSSFFFKSFGSIFIFFGSFLIAHTIMWIVDGNLHVYLLDSFLCVSNSGLDNVINFIVWANEKFKKTTAVDCVLIYGSFCRGMFHGRSDLDLRVVRKKGKSVVYMILLLYVAVIVRFVSLLKGIPTDLQVVDSLDFLNRQMRDDEKPVVVYSSDEINIPNHGYMFTEVLRDFSLVSEEDRSS